MADPLTAPPLIPSSIAEAHAKIEPYIHKTPLITSKTINAIASHPNPLLFLSSTPPSLNKPSPDSHHSEPYPPPSFNLYFKCENEQKIGAFKARGAHHALIRLIATYGIDHVRQRGVITHSSGNHAQALALAASTFGVPSYIVMPAISTSSKIAGTRSHTDHVFFSGSTSSEREAKVAEIMADTGAILVPPYNHPDIILGQGTAAFEMEAQYQDMKKREKQDSSLPTHMSHIETSKSAESSHSLPAEAITTAAAAVAAAEEQYDKPHFDLVLTPIGGGGLLGGTAVWFSHTSPPSSLSPSNLTATTTTTTTTAANSNANAKPTKKTLVIGAEPSHEGANDAQIGLAANPPKRIEHVRSLTVADGLRTPVGPLNWEIVSDTSKVAAVYSVSDEQIKHAMRLMMERVKVFIEPSAAVPVAVVLFCDDFRRWVSEIQANDNNGRKPWDVGIILSGGNTTLEAVAKLFGEQVNNIDNNEQGKNGIKGERETGQIGLDNSKKVEDVAG